MELKNIKTQTTWSEAAESINSNNLKIITEVTKLQGSTYKNKGYFKTLSDLLAAFPTASVGSKAYVGLSYPYAIYLWENNSWVDSGATGGEESVNLDQFYTKDETDSQISALENETDAKLTELEKEVIYDVTANNSGITFASLSELLSSDNLSTLIPTSVRHGGMTIRFIQSSDNKYVQYRLMNNTFSTTESDWQGIDDEPTLGSKNFVESNTLAKKLLDIDLLVTGESLVSDHIVKKLGYITNNGVIVDSVSWYYSVIKVSAGDTINIITESKEDIFPFIGIASSEDVSIGDSVSVVHGKVYTAETDSFIVLSVVRDKDVSVKILSESYLSQQTENTPTLNSKKLVTSHGIKTAIDSTENKIDSVDNKITQVTIAEPISANYEEGKAVKIVDNSYEKYDAEGYVVSALIPYAKNTQLVWYSGFLTQDLTKQLIFLDTEQNYSTYWNSYKDNNFINTVDNSKNGFILATFFLRDDYDCRIEDKDGNVIYRPIDAYNEYYINLEKIKNNYQNDNYEGSELFIGNVKNIYPKIYGKDSTNLSFATMESSILVPYRGATLTFVLPDSIIAGVITAQSGIGETTTHSGLLNKDIFTLPVSAALYRIFFYMEGNLIDAKSVNEMIATGKIKVLFSKSRNNIISDNSDAEKYIKAILYKLHVGREVIGNNFVPNMPTFIHISDIHGDAERLNRCLDYADYIGVDAVLLSGDIVNFNADNGAGFVNTIADNHTTPIYLCIGNHDVYSTKTFQEQYDLIIKHSILKNDVIVPDVSVEPYPTYYYKDLTASNIRLIVLNQWYQDGSVYYSQSQADFFVDALQTTPQDYGVIVMSHSPEGRPTLIQGYDKFYQPVVPGGDAYATFNGEHFIKDIIDAFIAKTSINKTYTKDGYDSVTVSVDFANVNTGVQFLFQATGHEHVDWIGMTKDATQRQIMMNITTGASIYGRGIYQAEWAEDSDLPRGGKGSVQDAFNIYAIDREANAIRIARVGSNITNNLLLRDYMILPL